MHSLLDCRLYGILDFDDVTLETASEVARQMISGDVDLLQIRAKRFPSSEIPTYAARVWPRTMTTGTPLIINDYPSLVGVTQAAGVHIGQHDGSIAAARAQAGEGAVIGRSTHSVEQALRARDEGADYLTFGPLFGTAAQPGFAPLDLDEIARVHQEIPDWPIFCFGGITLENLPRVLEAGARRMVIVSSLLLANDVAGYARRAATMLRAAARA